MPAGNSKNKTQQSGQKANDFKVLCGFIKDKCDEMKSNDPSEISNTLEEVSERAIADSVKLPEGASEKTALNVLALLMPIMDAIVSSRNDSIHKEHEVKITRLQSGLRKAKFNQDALEQYTRRENVRISGLPEAADESTESLIRTVISLGESVAVNISESDVSAIHRLGKKTQNRSRQVIVRFTNRTVRNRFLAARKKLKDSASYKDIYVTEDLTQLRFKLLHMVKGCEDVKTAFTREGKIHAIMKNGSKEIIDNPDDLFKLGFDNVDFQKLGLSDL